MRVKNALDAVAVTASAREAIDRELPKMAGADLETVPMITSTERAAVHDIVAVAFMSAFRLSQE